MPAGLNGPPLPLNVDVKVPGVVGRSAKDACTMLVEAKLSCDPQPAGQPALVVSTQTPAADHHPSDALERAGC